MSKPTGGNDDRTAAGNDDCEPGETQDSCPADCACGNGVCDPGEDNNSCSDDCFCGNGACDLDETNAACPGDCAALGDPACPGDGICFDYSWGTNWGQCYDSCADDADCREAEGHSCFANGTCWAE
jgi:hypothetical protein